MWPPPSGYSSLEAGWRLRVQIYPHRQHLSVLEASQGAKRDSVESVARAPAAELAMTLVSIILGQQLRGARVPAHSQAIA
jgi:hypothetical protein